jgi:cytochrome c oxidase cbb3-type subunit 3
MFVITIVWGIGYLIAYPGMGNFPGVLGWTSLDQHEQEVAVAEEKYRGMRDRYLAMPIEEVAQDEKARKMGMRIYGNNCSQCHGLDAAGALGFPNLADSDWLYGGTPDMIKHTIVNGRRAAMPAWESILGEDGIAEATAYILSLNSRDADPVKVAAGEKHYQTYCVACHGPEAKGNQALGAPNLTNGIWLYGGNAEQIAHSLRIGRNGQMPAFANTLGEDKIHLVSAYIYGLSK